MTSYRLTATDPGGIYKNFDGEDVVLMYRVSDPLFSAMLLLSVESETQRKQERPEQLGVGTDILFRRRSPSSLT